MNTFVRFSNTGAPAWAGDWREVVGCYQTQAAADAATIGDGAITGAVDDQVEPGYWIDTGTVTEGSTRQVSKSLPADPHADLRLTLTKLHAAGVVLSGVIDQIAIGYPDDARAAAQNYLFRVRQFTWLLAHSGAYTKAQKIAWALRMETGPADIPVADTEPATLAVAIQKFMDLLQGGSVTVPDGPRAWVNPATGQAVNLADAVTIAGSLPTGANAPILATGSWIQTFTVPADPED